MSRSLPQATDRREVFQKGVQQDCSWSFKVPCVFGDSEWPVARTGGTQYKGRQVEGDEALRLYDKGP